MHDRSVQKNRRSPGSTLILHAEVTPASRVGGAGRASSGRGCGLPRFRLSCLSERVGVVKLKASRRRSAFRGKTVIAALDPF